MRTPSWLAAAMALSVATGAVAQEGDITFKSTELATGLYMLEGVGGFAGGNLGLLVGDDGVVLIDDSMAPLSDAMMAGIRQVTDADVDFVINTHVHGDHIGNNAMLGAAGATIVTHDNIRRRMIDDGIRGPEGMVPAPKDALPELTFNDSVTFHLNGHEAYVFHVANAHTDGDAIIHFREANVIHAGDVLFNGMYPFIDLDTGGSVAGFIHALERILAAANADTRIIAGHGPVAKKADVEAARDMLVAARDRVDALVRAGKSEEDILADNPLADFDADWTWGFIDTERMTRTLIRSLTTAR